MLYEEALYTVLHRAGTMGPDQVDDEEALAELPAAGEPQALPPLGWPGPAWGWPRHFPHLLVSLSPQRHTELPHIPTHTGAQADTHRLTGMPRKVDTQRHPNRRTHRGHSSKEHWKRQADRCRVYTEGWSRHAEKGRKDKPAGGQAPFFLLCALPHPMKPPGW